LSLLGLLTLIIVPAAMAADKITVQEDVVYGKGGQTELKLDLARPAGEGPFPAIVYIHGGGWRAGNRKMYRKEIEEAAHRGYVAVTVTYRLTDPDQSGKARNPFPVQVNDVKCAVRWLRANAEKYHVDPQRIGAKGASAGGHLSLMLAVTDTSQALEGDGGYPDVSSRVQAVVNYFGPTDMPQLHATSPGAAPILDVFLGGGPEQAAEAYKAASPITHLSADDPPILTIHGAVDKLVPIDQATRFDERAHAVGVSHSLLTLEGQPHGFRGGAEKKALEAGFEFFDKHLKGAR